jgi:hypothetical protein
MNNQPRQGIQFLQLKEILHKIKMMQVLRLDLQQELMKAIQEKYLVEVLNGAF